MFTKYRRKPVVIEAMQWDGTEAGALEIKALVPCADYYANTNHIQMSQVWINPQDWIIKNEDGVIQVYSTEEFAAKYTAIRQR